MIEKVTVRLDEASAFVPENGSKCGEINPKQLLLYAGAQCVGLTALHIMQRERIRPNRFEISLSGELSTQTVQSESEFVSFHAVYNVAVDSEDDQAKVSRAINLAHDKYCGTLRMLRKIAPLSHEVAIVSTQPEKVEN